MPRGQGVYQVSGTGAVWLLENDEWHWAPTQESFFAWGYSWADVQAIDLATFCQYPVGQRLTEDGTNFTGVRGYIPSSDRAALDCSKVAPPEPPPPEPTPPPPEPTPPPPEPTPPPPAVPTGFLWIAWAWNPGGTESSIRSGYNQLLSLGINAFLSQHHIDDYKDSAGATDWYDMVYRIAGEMGIRVIWYTGVHRLEYKGAKTGEPFVTRYSKLPACGGFTYGDEPNYMGWEHSGCKWAVDEAHRQGASPSRNPMFAVFGYDLSVNYAKTYTPGCEIFDVGCACCYPTALAGPDWKSFLEYWVNHGYHRPNNDGFGDCGKGMIPVIQAHVEKPTAKHGDLMPDLVGEYNVWKAKYGNQIKGIGLWLPYADGDAVGFLESGSKGDQLRNQIRELTGGPPSPPPPTYTCPHCGATFSSQADLDAHVASVHHYVCPHCGATFITQAELDAHIASEHPAPVFTCPHCGATFSSQAELDDHIASVHPPVVFTCPECGLTFGTQAELDTHIAFEHPVFTCPECGDIFDSQAELDAHIASEHPAPVFTCPDCGLTFGTQAELDLHIASEHPPLVYTCPECGDIFASQAELDSHIATVHPPAVYTCPHCGATFDTEADLDAHIASTHPAPVYECPHCGATFVTQEELDIHIASEHPAPVYECPHCGLTFAAQVELEAHVASEHPAAPVFKCIYCGAIFASQEDLNAHIATEHPIAAEVVPWWKSWKTYLALGGLGTLIGGIVIKKRLAKRRKSNTMV